MTRLIARLSLISLPLLLAVPVFAAGDGDGGGVPHLPSLVKWLSLWFHAKGLYEWINVIYAFLTSLIFIFVAMRVYANRKMIPGPFQNFIEMLVEGVYNFLYSILGKDTKTYLPWLGTLFFYIFVNNMWGIIPLGHSPSTSLSITGSLAVITFLFVQYTGLRRLGFVGYWRHMAGLEGDNIRNPVMWVLLPLQLPMHIIGEFAKPFSLALRLFGNITGEDVLVAAFVVLGISALSFMGSPVGLPLNIPFVMLGTLLSLIQALVFTLLSTIYILMMLPHEEHH